MVHLNWDQIKTPNAIIKRAYSGPGMALNHLLKRVEQLRPMAAKDVGKQLTQNRVKEWFAANAQENRDVLERSDPFYAPTTRAGTPDRRYRTENPEVSKVRYQLFHKEINFVGAPKLYALAKSRFPHLPFTRRGVEAWRRTQETNSVHRSWKRSKTIFRRHATAAFKILNVDLKIMDYAMYPSDGGPNAYRAIFTALDLWSRKMYAVPIKNKEGSTVAAAIKKVFDSAKQPYSAVQSDQGSEFVSAEFKKAVRDHHGAKQFFSTPGHPQSNPVECVNKTLAKSISVLFRTQNDRNWPAKLPAIVKSHNATIHSALNGLAPGQAEAGWIADDTAVIDRVNAEFKVRAKSNASNLTDKVLFNPGDLVRVRLTAGGTKTSSSVNWSREPFSITKLEFNRQGKDPKKQTVNYQVRYKLKRYVDPNALYKWTGKEYSVFSLRKEAQKQGFAATGTRIQLVARLQDRMDGVINGLYPEPYPLSGLRKAELQVLARARQLDGSGSVAQLKRRLKPILDPEDDNLEHWYTNDELQKYYRPKGKRTDKHSGYEKSDRTFMVQELVRPYVDDDGDPSYLVRWVGWRRPTGVKRSVLQSDLPRVVELFEKKREVKWTLSATPPTVSFK